MYFVLRGHAGNMAFQRLKKTNYFWPDKAELLTTLFALFPCRWENLSEAEGLELRLGWRWTTLLQGFKSFEKAIFFSSLTDEEPGAYPATWRRFIRVGSSLPEQVANLFELCYEKGYEQVIFSETLCASIPEAALEEFLSAAGTCEMVLLPAEDGSLLMVSMQMHLFPEWNFFRFHAPGAVVEMLSECHDKQITYRLFDSRNSENAGKDLKKLLQHIQKPELN